MRIVVLRTVFGSGVGKGEVVVGVDEVGFRNVFSAGISWWPKWSSIGESPVLPLMRGVANMRIRLEAKGAFPVTLGGLSEGHGFVVRGVWAGPVSTLSSHSCTGRSHGGVSPV